MQTYTKSLYIRGNLTDYSTLNDGFIKTDGKHIEKWTVKSITTTSTLLAQDFIDYKMININANAAAVAVTFPSPTTLIQLLAIYDIGVGYKIPVGLALEDNGTNAITFPAVTGVTMKQEIASDAEGVYDLAIVITSPTTYDVWVR